MSKIESYRPSNSDDGWAFIDKFCANCHHDKPDEEQYCGIIGRTLGLPENHPEYPTEWVIENNEPRCTAFAPIDQPLIIRDDRTIDMFAARRRESE